jgi:hypothetical protein
MPGIGKPFIPQVEFTRLGRGFVGPIFPLSLLEYKGLSPIAKVVWAALAAFAGKDGNCYPSYQTLAKKAGISRRAIAKAIQELRRGGFIEWKGGGPGKSNCYYFIWHEIFNEDRFGARVQALTISQLLTADSAHCAL